MIQNDIKETTTAKGLTSINEYVCGRYYHAFDYILDDQDFVFEKRTEWPPQNPINALISFGNSMCYTIVLSEIYKTYLDPRIAYLHSSDFNQFTLNLDVAQIFMPILVDRLIFKLVNRKMITIKDFTSFKDGIALSKDGKRKLIQELDNYLKTTVKHRQLDRSVSYRRLIRLELYKIQKHILEEREYEPYRSFW